MASRKATTLSRIERAANRLAHTHSLDVQEITMTKETYVVVFARPEDQHAVAGFRTDDGRKHIDERAERGNT